MSPEEFRAWRSRMKLTIGGSANVIGVKFSTARDYGQGVRRVPQYIENLCYLIEQKKLMEDFMAKAKTGDGQAQQLAQMMAAAYIAARRKRNPAVAMTMNAASEAEYMAEVLKELNANGVKIGAENKQAAG